MMINILIFLVGLAVYWGYGAAGFLYLAGAVLLSYGAGLLTKRFPWAAWGCVGLNALALCLLKLQSAAGLSLLAPFGASYFTLQLISYNIDVARGKYPAERNLFRYALSVMYLPRLYLGPIERTDFMISALDSRRITLAGIFSGGARALWGLAKKLIVASRMGVIIGAISADPETYRGAYALAATVLYSVQLYCDFSGGIDTVLGISEMLGIRLHENFDAPFLSQTFQEFWRRWHMTLGGWLREYIYIPLGGNRKGKARKFLNLVVTFLVSGLWHGVEYILWGLINGIFVACGETFKTPFKTLNRLVTFLLVSLLWAFFIWPDAQTAVSMVVSVFTTFNYADFAAVIGTLGLTLGDWIVAAVAAAVIWCCDVQRSGLRLRYEGFSPAGKTAAICLLALLVLIFGMYGIGFNAEAFIYSRF